MFRDGKIKLIKARLSTKLYFAHHHYAKYYVYGLVPAIVTTLDNSLKDQLYTGAPIFNEQNQLVSFVTDCYMDQKCVILVTGECHRISGMICLDGNVRVICNNEQLNLPPFNNIDMHVKYDNKTIKLYLVYCNQILSHIVIHGTFAGNVLIN